MNKNLGCSRHAIRAYCCGIKLRQLDELGPDGSYDDDLLYLLGKNRVGSTRHRGRDINQSLSWHGTHSDLKIFVPQLEI